METICPDCNNLFPEDEAIYDDGYKSCWNCYVKHLALKGQVVMIDEHIPYVPTPLDGFRRGCE
jgi:hypothetical protein